MSINWNAEQNSRIFTEGIKVNELNPLQTGDDLVVNHTALNVDTIDSNKTSNVNIKGTQLGSSGVLTANQINVDLIQEKTNNQGVSISDTLKVDTIEESTTSERVSFPNSIKVDEIASFTGGSNVLFNNNVDIGSLRVSSINKLVSNLTIDLGHSNSSEFNYFSTYSNSSALGFTSDNSDFGNIGAGDLQLLRINNFVFCYIYFRSFVSPQDSFGDVSGNPIPSRFRPSIQVNHRKAMASDSATANNVYINMDTTGGFRIGFTDQDDALVTPGSNDDVVITLFWTI